MQSPHTVSTLNQRLNMDYIEDDDQRKRCYHRPNSRVRGRVAWTPGGDLRQLAQDFLDAMTTQGYSPNSVVHYRMTLKPLLNFLGERGRQRAQDVTVEDLEAYRLKQVERGFAFKSLHSFLRVVPQFFGCLEAGQVLFSNPAADFQVPRLPYRFVPVPDEDEIKRLLEQPDVSTPVGLRDRALLETAYSTGARREELANLTLDRLNFANRTARLYGKGRKERIVPLGKHAAHWLERYLKEARGQLLQGREETAVWVGTFGRRLLCKDLGKRIAHVARTGNLKISPHTLRRACATHMLRHGAHPVLIQELLGHTSGHSLKHYLRLTLDDLKKTINRSNPGR
jgi:integrase/recombinase XerD